MFHRFWSFKDIKPHAFTDVSWTYRKFKFMLQVFNGEVCCIAKVWPSNADFNGTLYRARKCCSDSHLAQWRYDTLPLIKYCAHICLLAWWHTWCGAPTGTFDILVMACPLVLEYKLKNDRRQNTHKSTIWKTTIIPQTNPAREVQRQLFSWDLVRERTSVFK
jgi:hypothetical protein